MTCPLVEYLINKMRYYYFFDKHQLTPVDGKITLPERPGFGIEIDDAKLVQAFEDLAKRFRGGGSETRKTPPAQNPVSASSGANNEA